MAVDPAIVKRMRALRARRGYKLYVLTEDALNSHLDKLEGLEVRPVTAPARFKRARKRAEQNDKSVFAPMIKS